MAILKGTGLEFPNSDLLTGVIGPNYVARWATATQSYNHDHLGLEVIMPGAKSNNSKYLIIAEANVHTSNNSATGAGIRFWCETASNGSGWTNKQGQHEEYNDGNRDPYYVVHNMIIDDGDNSGGNNNTTGTHTGAGALPIVAGESRKYRAYGHANNNNLNWCEGVGRQSGWRAYLCVIELDGSICS